jgi:hypothetical protein
MKINIEVDADMMDGIIACALTQSIDYTETEIKHLKKKKNLKEHEKEDLKCHTLNLDSLKRVRYYFGGQKYFYE